MRHRQPVQLPLPRVDLRQHRPAGRTAGPRGIPGRGAALRRPDRAAGHRVRRIPLGVTGSGSDAGRGHPPRAARRRTRLLGYRPLVPARREGARLRDQLETRDRHVRRELPFRHRAPADLRHDRAQQLHGVRLLRAASSADLPAQHDPGARRHTRGPVEPVPQHGGDLRAVPQHRAVGDYRQRRAVPRLPRRSARPVDHRPPERNTARPFRRIRRRGRQAVFDYAHATVRDEDYRLVESLQANLESGARDHLVFGRNEPGLQHRHITWAKALAASTG